MLICRDSQNLFEQTEGIDIIHTRSQHQFHISTKFHNIIIEENSDDECEEDWEEGDNIGTENPA